MGTRHMAPIRTTSDSFGCAALRQSITGENPMIKLTLTVSVTAEQTIAVLRIALALVLLLT